jgi:WD40 repeat protein
MVRLWDAVDEPCDMFPWKQAEITSLAFVAPKSRNEGLLAVGVSERDAGKGSIYVFPTRGSWFASDSCPPLGDGIELPKENRAGSWPTSVAISPDGEAIAAGAPDSVLRLWTKSVNGWERQTSTSPGSGGVWSVAWLPGAERPTCLVSGWGQPQPSRSGAQDTLSGEIRLFPADKPLAAPVRSLFIHDVREKLPEMPVLSLAVTRDGTMLAAGTRRPGRVIVWRAAPAGASPCDFPVREELLFAKEPPTRDAGWDVKSVTFSPDAKLLAAGIDDGSIRVWSLADPGQTPGKLTGAGAPVKSIAFDSDGRYLAAGLANGHVLLWDRGPLQTPAAAAGSAEIQPVLIGNHSGPVNTVAFAPDGHTILTGADDGKLKRWYTTSALAERVCGLVGRNLSQAEWKKHVGVSVEYACTCAGFPPEPSTGRTECPSP